MGNGATERLEKVNAVTQTATQERPAVDAHTMPIPDEILKGPSVMHEMAVFVWESIAESLDTWGPGLWTEAAHFAPSDPDMARYWNILLAFRPVAESPQRFPCAARLREMANEIRRLAA